MDNDNPDQSAVWVPPKFHFQVQWDGMDMSFQEVSGLDTKTESIEYRQGASSLRSPKLSGIKLFKTVTMKKGIFTADEKFWNFFNQIKTNTAKFLPMTIRLINENENAATIMKWTLSDARPSKITGSNLKSDGKEIEVEFLEIVHTGVTVDKD